MPENQKIVCVHLLNDYSGSPSILAQSLRVLKDSGKEVVLYTSKGPGLLDDAPVTRKKVWYTWSANKYRRLLNYTLNQILIFFRVLVHWREPVTFYINTLLPAGAAIAAKLMGKKVVYHIHETHIDPPAFNKILVKVVSMTADKIIYVSEFLENHHRFPKVPYEIIHNAVPEGFSEEVEKESMAVEEKEGFEVLMMCSLRKLKGIFEYIEVARRLPNIRFTLVMSQTLDEIQKFLADETVPENLTLVPRQTNVHPYYAKADLLMNMSHPEKMQETFGMTIIEGLSYGLPAIVPPVGGPREIITDQVDGYHLDSREIPPIVETIKQLQQNPELYGKLSRQAQEKAKKFSQEEFGKAIKGLF